MKQSLRTTTLLLSLLLSLCLSCKHSSTAGEEEITANLNRPNIIMIVADDMGWHDLGAYGNDFMETPNLDRLAETGIKFTDAYAGAPLCSPSRAALMTGLHPIAVNITEHIHGNQPAGPNQKLKTPPISQHLDLDYITIAEALKEQDYHTGFIGKWHLGGGQWEPQHQGFDLNIAGSYNGLPRSFFYPFFSPGEKPEIQEDSQEGDYLTDVLTNKALEYITRQKDSAFFLSLNYYSPHVPIEGKDSLVQKYIDKRGTAADSILPNVHYAAMIESIDINVGRIIKSLNDLQIADNTLIIFTSDNGGLSVEEVPAFAKHTPPTDNGPLRAGKGYLYEGGIREPLIMSWPAGFKNAKIIDKPVIAQDLFNTLTAITQSTQKTGDGVSLLPLVEQDNLEERGLLWHLPHYSPQHGKPATAYRKGDFKIIHFYEDDRYELYNLKEDKSETNDLSEANPQKLESLKAEMENQLGALGAQFPEPNPNYKGE
ncbi:sulfatase [Croceiramulus getboli]|nr:sulfatase [Flavobacteriaceae bacterium YJPT1-3]